MKRLFTLFFVLLTIVMGARAEESFSTWLDNYGSQKIEVIKLLKNELDITLSEAQNLVNAAPCCVAHGRTQTETQDLVAKLNDKGATAELRVDINAANFPDDTFRTYVAENCQSDGDNDHLSNVEIAAVKEISVIEKNITSLKGVEFFTALETLDCNCNYKIKSLDLSKNVNLKYLDCSVTQLTTLDLTNNTKLVKLRCLTIGLPSLDVTKNTALVSLNCSGNKLTSLDVTKNTALTYLNCYHNNLTSVNVTKNIALQNLDCSYNQLTSLNLAQNTTLDTLYCFSNKLTSLDLSKNTKLKILQCYRNQLTSLDLSKNTALILFSCSNNQLTSLDLSKNTSLTNVSCSCNRLKGLDVTNNTALNRISCYTNQIGEAAMFEFVMSLPDGGSGKWLTVYNEGEDEGQIESNVITKEQVAIAKGKGWNVYLLNEEFSSVSYEGVDPTGLPVTKTNFPDATFRAYVKANCQSDGDDILTDEEIAAVKTISVRGKNVTNLKGVEFFTALTELYCDYNQLTALNISKNTKLTKLDCDGNQLKKLDVTKNTALIELNCGENQLTTLNVTKNTKLKTLYCHSNQLTSLNMSKNTALVNLNCIYNQLASLDVSKSTKLDLLECDHNKLTSLDVSTNTNLHRLYCEHNQLGSLIVANNSTKLSQIWCYVNQLDEAAMYKFVMSLPQNPMGQIIAIDGNEEEGNVMTTEQVAIAKAKGWQILALSGDNLNYEGTEPTGVAINETNFPDATFRAYVKSSCQSDGDDYLTATEKKAVTKIDVHNKGITSLKGVERFTALKELLCYTNKITALDVTKNTQLTRLACNSNKLKTLDLTKNTKLENLNCSSNQLTSLNVTKNTKLWRLVCSSNKLTTLNVSKNTLLTEFKCNENQLTALTVTNNKKLTTLECCNNQIGEEAMDKLVKSMPTVSGTPGVFVPFNLSKADGNVINTRQVNEAKAKNWNVKALKNSDYVDYEGVIPSGIDEVTVEPATEGRHYTDDRYYTLDGRPLDAAPTQRGIYIHHGKKIVVK